MLSDDSTWVSASSFPSGDRTQCRTGPARRKLAGSSPVATSQRRKTPSPCPKPSPVTSVLPSARTPGSRRRPPSQVPRREGHRAAAGRRRRRWRRHGRGRCRQAQDRPQRCRDLALQRRHGIHSFRRESRVRAAFASRVSAAPAHPWRDRRAADAFPRSRRVSSTSTPRMRGLVRCRYRAVELIRKFFQPAAASGEGFPPGLGAGPGRPVRPTATAAATPPPVHRSHRCPTPPAPWRPPRRRPRQAASASARTGRSPPGRTPAASRPGRPCRRPRPPVLPTAPWARSGVSFFGPLSSFNPVRSQTGAVVSWLPEMSRVPSGEKSRRTIPLWWPFSTPRNFVVLTSRDRCHPCPYRPPASGRRANKLDNSIFPPTRPRGRGGPVVLCRRRDRIGSAHGFGSARCSARPARRATHRRKSGPQRPLANPFPERRVPKCQFQGPGPVRRSRPAFDGQCFPIGRERELHLSTLPTEIGAVFFPESASHS